MTGISKLLRSSRTAPRIPAGEPISARDHNRFWGRIGGSRLYQSSAIPRRPPPTNRARCTQAAGPAATIICAPIRHPPWADWATSETRAASAHRAPEVCKARRNSSLRNAVPVRASAGDRAGTSASEWPWSTPTSRGARPGKFPYLGSISTTRFSLLPGGAVQDRESSCGRPPAEPRSCPSADGRGAEARNPAPGGGASSAARQTPQDVWRGPVELAPLDVERRSRIRPARPNGLRRHSF
jgi:hypothetical protein